MSKRKLTAEMLENMKPGIFDHGETIDSPEGINMRNTGTPIKRVAVRGTGYHDRAIYARGDRNKYISDNMWIIAAMGDKISLPYIKNLFEGDQDVWDLYRE